MINIGGIIMPNHCTVQIQLSERTVIQWWRSRTCCQLIQDQTGSLNPSATLYILKLTKLSSRQDKDRWKNARWKMPQSPTSQAHSLNINIVWWFGKLVIRAFYLNIPGIFPPASCWGYGSCDSVLLSSLQNVEKNNWIKTDWQDL